MSRERVYKQAQAPEPDFEVVGVHAWSEGMNGALVLMREPLLRDDAPGGDEGGGGEE